MGRRENRLNAHFKKLVAEFVSQNANVKISLVTVTDFAIDNEFRHATAYITIFPDAATELAFDLLKRKTSDLHHYLQAHSQMQTVPAVKFELDKGEKNRQRIEELIKK